GGGGPGGARGGGGGVGGDGGLVGGAVTSAGSAGAPTAGAVGTGVDFPIGCSLFGDACVDTDECCSHICTDGVCSSNVIECGGPGDSCGADTDCCNLNCVDSECSAAACTPDDEACAGSGECCSGTCTNDRCVALNPACATAGNPCDDGGDCCSGLCGDDGMCVRASSFCVQNGDICRSAAECCSAACDLGANGVGTCAPIEIGSANCDGLEGMLCDGCNGCCSRVCAPDRVTGVLVCQPARGCHVMGDLCRRDADCCGADGTDLPGAGNVHCRKDSPDDPVGICRSPTGCNPQGNVCHYQDYVCSNSSSRNNCCGATGESGRCERNAAGELVCGGTGFLCQPDAEEGDECESCLLDPFGVPRCNALGECRVVGETCATSADCCDQMPCVPDEDGVLRCGATICVDAGGTCTVDADCCTGIPCLRPIGSVQGVCGGESPPTGGSGGAPPAAGGTAGAPAGGTAGSPTGGGPATGGVPTECALYGQLCEEDADCCNPGLVFCDNGVCLAPLR
ncbi:MAG: hypothetical protein JW751_31240, partial [Polyangiaceae bacterium]|nr:hypothetical protein [Polyangiaceae bacterium]